MQFAIIRGRYMPRALLIAGKNALTNRSASVTSAAAKMMKIKIPTSLFLKSGISRRMRLLQKRTKIKQSPIVRAGLRANVTASIGHRPISKTKEGFFPHRPFVRPEK